MAKPKQTNWFIKVRSRDAARIFDWDTVETVHSLEDLKAALAKVAVERFKRKSDPTVPLTAEDIVRKDVVRIYEGRSWCGINWCKRNNVV